MPSLQACSSDTVLILWSQNVAKPSEGTLKNADLNQELRNSGKSPTDRPTGPGHDLLHELRGAPTFLHK